MEAVWHKHIRYLTHKDIDKQLWDKCIAESQLHLPYAYSWVLDILHPNWNALVCEKYEAVLPLPYKTKFGLKALIQSPWLQQLGVFSSIDSRHNYAHNQAMYKQFFRQIPRKYIRQYCRVNTLNSELEQPSKFIINRRKNYVLPLNEAYSDIRSQFSKNTKRNINKAEKKELKVVKNIDIEDLINVYEKYVFPKQKGIVKNDILSLKKLISTILNQKKGFILGVHNAENNLLCANFFWQEKSRIISLLPCSTTSGKQQLTMFFLMNELIKKYANQDFILDFEGSSVENIARFNKGFGGKEEYFLELRYRVF